MARQRMVKPEFFDSESLGACSIPARLAFIGLWIEADDYGRMKLQPKRLMKRIFPYDRINLSKFVGYLAELERVGCIRTYEVDGEDYICVPNFSVYQTINRPSKSIIPAPEKQQFSEQSLNIHGALTLKEKKEISSSGFSKTTTTKEKETAQSDAAADEPAPLHAKVPTCPECGAILKATCTKGATTWNCRQHGIFSLSEAVLK